MSNDNKPKRPTANDRNRSRGNDKKRIKNVNDLDGGFATRKGFGGKKKADDAGDKPAKGGQKGKPQGKKPFGKQGGKPSQPAFQQKVAKVNALPRKSTWDFNEEVNRRNTYSFKWDIANDELPMWVADMDLKTAPCVTEALAKRVNSGIFGYTVVPPEFDLAVISWWKRRHRISFDTSSVLFCNGVIPAVTSIVGNLTDLEDSILLMSPNYNCFYTVIKENARNLIECELAYDGKYYSIDWEDLEEKLSDDSVSMMILCNPHNPIGKTWSKDELARIGELCDKYDVVVVSDEIWCDIVKPGVKHIPFAAASETCRDICITACSPSKAFNIAGIQSAYLIVENPALRHLCKEALTADRYNEPNVFAIDSTIAAYTEGEEWLDALNKHIQANKDFATHYINQRMPEVVVVPSEATYVIWLDCMEMGADATELQAAIREETGLILSPGYIYGNAGRPFMRMNVACSRAQLEDALRRLDSFFNFYE